jgi:hypothetical protein
MSDTVDLFSAVFAKTELGQQEIQSRALGLTPLVRRILVLADGKKTGGELAAFLPAAEGIAPVLEQLLSLGCLRAEVGAKPAARTDVTAASAPARAASPPPSADVPGLVPAEDRGAKDNEMARNFMINSINSIIGQHMRISLIADIAGAKTTAELRTVYRAWEASMSDHGMGKKRLPELKEKLFKVL